MTDGWGRTDLDGLPMDEAIRRIARETAEDVLTDHVAERHGGGRAVYLGTGGRPTHCGITSETWLPDGSPRRSHLTVDGSPAGDHVGGCEMRQGTPDRPDAHEVIRLDNLSPWQREWLRAHGLGYVRDCDRERWYAELFHGTDLDRTTFRRQAEEINGLKAQLAAALERAEAAEKRAADQSKAASCYRSALNDAARRTFDKKKLNEQETDELRSYLVVMGKSWGSGSSVI